MSKTREYLNWVSSCILLRPLTCYSFQMDICQCMEVQELCNPHMDGAIEFIYIKYIVEITYSQSPKCSSDLKSLFLASSLALLFGIIFQ